VELFWTHTQITPICEAGVVFVLIIVSTPVWVGNIFISTPAMVVLILVGRDWACAFVSTPVVTVSILVGRDMVHVLGHTPVITVSTPVVTVSTPVWRDGVYG
jgi:hypothetical protein